MTLPECYKKLTWGDHEKPLLLYPWQLGKLQALAGSLEEISNLGGPDTNPLESTLTILATDFFNVLEHINEEIPEESQEYLKELRSLLSRLNKGEEQGSMA